MPPLVLYKILKLKMGCVEDFRKNSGQVLVTKAMAYNGGGNCPEAAYSRW